MAAAGGTPGTPAALPNLSQIRNWDTTHLEQAARDWTTAAEVWEDSFSRALRASLNPGGTDWGGQAAEATKQRTLSDLYTARGLTDHLHRAASVARGGVSELDYAKQQVLDIVRRAESAGFDVHDDLSLSTRLTFAPGPEMAAKSAEGEALSAEINARAALLMTLDLSVAGKITTTIRPLSEVSFPTTLPETPLPSDGTVQMLDTPIPEPVPEPGLTGNQTEQSTPKTWQDILVPAELADTPSGGTQLTPEPLPAKTSQVEDDHPRNLDEAQSVVAGFPAVPPPSALDKITDAHKNAPGKGEDKPNPGSPLDVLAVASDPKIVDRQADRVDAAHQSLADAQTNADSLAAEWSMSRPGTGPTLDDLDAAGRAVFDARRGLTEQTEGLKGLSQAQEALGGLGVPIPSLPPNIDVQAFPPQPSAFADASQALSEGSHGFIPDVAKDIHVFTNWGESSGNERTQAVLDAAGLVPIPGSKALTEGIERGLDGLAGAARHIDDAPTPLSDVPSSGHNPTSGTPSIDHPADAGHHAPNEVEDVGALLATSESAGGHLLERHVSQSLDDLSARLEADPRPGAVSTFASTEEATTAVSSALQHNQAAVDAWSANGATDRLRLSVPFDGGEVLVRGSRATVPATSVVVVLEGIGNGRWIVLTGYPIP
ncbi:RNase A-like domain-containing protein [Mycolicibacterium confluentis]|uniref:Uncharacterized protein n=1 Tax=Mycolicibacterium confluentis TaxID=28047 RepID=A0A7I7Y0D4_9MYCO|nr:RNase A-like domain-containing protein [Mycolicibacterium confluentis]MCV7319472.1 hypothetical protein [Mycolicibacterium confluentis]ORV34106.1 hypothetical protein AWB99_00135 [Mycolicibacterium confluentis]BBZ34492.1 hypothetical protein MCNF_30970 [Mycolicibacterium confluentis]